MNKFNALFLIALLNIIWCFPKIIDLIKSLVLKLFNIH